MRQSDRPVSGIICLIGGLFLYSIQDMVIRTMSDQYSLLQIMWIRAFVSLLLLLAIVRITHGWKGLADSRRSVMLLRGVLGALAYVAYYLAIVSMPLAEAVAIVFISPILVTVFSALIFRERVGRRRWAAVTLGFFAVLIVLGPQGQFFQVASALAAVAAVTYAGMILLTGAVKNHGSTLSIACHTAIGFLCAVIVVNIVVLMLPVVETDNRTAQFLMRDWRVPAWIDLSLLVGLGVVTTLAQYALIKAYTIAPMSAVAPFEYSYIVWAVLFGYWLWDEVPSIWTWVGLALLVSCNLYILYREQKTSALTP